MQLTNLKRLIVLKGVKNSGKTTTLNDVYNTLKVTFPQNTPIVDKVFKSNNGSPDDHLLVMRGRAGRLTAIHTAGDDANLIVRSFRAAERYGCEVLVMAVSVPVRQSTIPLAEIAFDEIVRANALQPNMYYTQRQGSGNINQTMQQLPNAIWQQM